MTYGSSFEFFFPLKKPKVERSEEFLFTNLRLAQNSCSEFSIVCTLVRNVNDDI